MLSISDITEIHKNVFCLKRHHVAWNRNKGTELICRCENNIEKVYIFFLKICLHLIYTEKSDFFNVKIYFLKEHCKMILVTSSSAKLHFLNYCIFNRLSLSQFKFMRVSCVVDVKLC